MYFFIVLLGCVTRCDLLFSSLFIGVYSTFTDPENCRCDIGLSCSVQLSQETVASRLSQFVSENTGTILVVVVVVILKKSERRSRGPLCPDLAEHNINGLLINLK